MRRIVLVVLTALCLTVWAVVLMLQRADAQTTTMIPTLMEFSSLTPTGTPFRTATPTPRPTLLTTWTPIPIATIVPTVTPTLAERILQISAVMPSRSVEPSITELPMDITALPAPPNPIEPLPDATTTAPPFTGWFSFESDYPTVRYEPMWTPRLAPFASRGQYHRTDAPNGMASFAFEGEGVRVRYVAARNMGIFELVIDQVVIDMIDAYAHELTFNGTGVYTLGPGSHLLEIRATGRKNDLSEGYVVGLDAIQVFRADATTLVIPPPVATYTPTALPQVVSHIELVSAPSTIQPTPTPNPPRVITAAIVIAYDENGNDSVDPAEGVAGISVRVVEANTNRVISSGFTDERGYIEFALVTDAPTRIVVPYFGETWDLHRGSTDSAPAYTLLLTPGNQPGLIP